jgi:glutaminase
LREPSDFWRDLLHEILSPAAGRVFISTSAMPQIDPFEDTLAASDGTLQAECISTGRLPSPRQVQAFVNEANRRYSSNTAGQNSDVYPVLRDAPDRFGICIASVNGQLYAAGEVDVPFTIMSISKPLVFALVCDAIGPAAAREQIGVNATGLPFNALEAIERGADGRTNPMVNPGAIATTSLVPGGTAEERWRFIHAGLSRFAGRALTVNEDIYACASASNHVNQTLVRALQAAGRLQGKPEEALDLYTRQCALDVTARDLAVMGATLANGGVNPLTGEPVISAAVCQPVLAVMTTAGLYETSGDWLYDVGLPGKSGIGGGIVTVSPGKGGLGTYAPRLDAAGNSVKGQLATRFLSRRLGMNIFASTPAGARSS